MATKKKTDNQTEANIEFLKIEDITMSLLYAGFSMFEVALLAKIMSLSNGKQGCTASNDWFYWYFNISESTLRRSLKTLKQRNLISVVEKKNEMKGTIRHIFVNLKEYHSLVKTALKKKYESQKQLKNSSDHPVKLTDDHPINLTANSQNEQVVEQQKPPYQNDTTTLSNWSDHPVKMNGSIIENNKDKNLIKGYGETPPPHCGLTPFDKNDDQLSTLEAIDDETIQTEEEDEMGIPRGETLQKISEYWDTINPIRKYEYMKANGSAAKHIAYSELDNPRNHMDFYSEPEVIRYFLDRNVPLEWIRDNCSNWWLCYEMNQELKKGLAFLEEEEKKS